MIDIYENCSKTGYQVLSYSYTSLPLLSICPDSDDFSGDWEVKPAPAQLSVVA
jgi:hypothetical protein